MKKKTAIIPATFDKSNYHGLCDKLAKDDADLKAILQRHGYPPMWTRSNSFETLVHIILEQQVSLASALAALNKLKEKLKRITPAAVLRLSDEEMRACFVSRQKMVYIRGLAQVLQSGKIKLEELEALSDDEIRATLIQLKGIGNWTIDVYLMFVLQRADVFPIGDLAAVNALKRLKNLDPKASKEELLQVAEQWQPLRSVACMMLWHFYLSTAKKAIAPVL